ncbi:MAG: Crp/Fnr family transcriptional regulator [Anaerorhabdus sp.]
MIDIKDSKLFINISDEEFEEINKKIIYKKINKGEIIFNIGSKLSDFYLILDGKVEVCSYDFNGNKKLIGIFNDGELFGESVALGQEKISPFEVSAVKDTDVVIIKQDTILNLPIAVLYNLVKIVSTKNTFLTHKVECLNKSTVKERLFEVLTYYHLKQQSNTIVIPFNKTQLAEYLCVNRSSLSREIKQMEDDGIIKVKKNKYFLSEKTFKML